MKSTVMYLHLSHNTKALPSWPMLSTITAWGALLAISCCCSRVDYESLKDMSYRKVSDDQGISAAKSFRVPANQPTWVLRLQAMAAAMLVKDYLMSFDKDLIKKGDALQFWSTEFANMLLAHVTNRWRIQKQDSTVQLSPANLCKLSKSYQWQ